MNRVENWDRVRVIDSHTGGEPTRVVIEGGPDLGRGSVAERRTLFARDHDAFRAAVVCEPRGSDVIVGALLCPPVDPAHIAAVIFFNNVGVIGMCGHGTIGLAVTLGHLGRIEAGTHRLETAVGPVAFEYDGRNRASLTNVPSFRLARGVSVQVDGVGRVTGDIAWGGNWFFLVDAVTGIESPEPILHGSTWGARDADRLTQLTRRIRQALPQQGVTGADGAEIDHIELFAPPGDPRNHSRNFVLCPGGAYDRSPCGTGTSAKLACLAADGKLAPGEVWRQESVLGSVFEGTYEWQGQSVIPKISGTAYVTADARLVFDPSDPFRAGISAGIGSHPAE